METYISVPLATMGIGLFLSVVALILLIKTSEKVRPAAWFFSFFAIALNGVGVYWLFTSPGIGTLISLWFFGAIAVGLAVYPVLRPYLVHGVFSEMPLLEECVMVFWPIAALGGYVLHIALGAYRPGQKREPADEVAPTTWEEARKKEAPPPPAEPVRATKKREKRAKVET